MLIIALSDIHARELNPVNRTDNYLGSLCSKLSQVEGVLQLAEMKSNIPNEKIIVAIAGDIFHSFRCSDSLKSTMITIFGSWYKHTDEIFVVAGQHDQRWHTIDLENTPLGILVASHAVTLMTDKPYNFVENGKVYSFYGASWNESIPEVEDKNAFNTLLIHRMISDKDYWYGHVDYTKCPDLLKEAKDYDLIISGDNHATFNHQNKILNSGSLMRSSIDQKDHKPSCFLWHNPKNVERIEFNVEPFDKIMKIEEFAEKKETETELIKFVDELQLNSELEELKFIDNVKVAMNSDSIDGRVKSIIIECIKDLE